MNGAELYHINNSVQRRDAIQFLEEYKNEIKWKNYGATIIDIGCGDGGVTTGILKPFISNNCKELIGCDISENMIQFANTHHAREFISFTVLDIESDLPKQFREKFDYAFSFYVLHWIKQHEIAFSNIYDLLNRNGECLLMFLGRNPIYDVFREMSLSDRWSCWMKDIDAFVSTYHDCEDPAKDIHIKMTSIGFTFVDVKCLEKVYVYTGKEYINSIKTINPFKIPLDMQEDFYKDFIQVTASHMKLIDQVNKDGDGPFNVKLDYNLIIVHCKK